MEETKVIDVDNDHGGLLSIECIDSPDREQPNDPREIRTMLKLRCVDGTELTAMCFYQFLIGFGQIETFNGDFVKSSQATAYVAEMAYRFELPEIGLASRILLVGKAKEQCEKYGIPMEPVLNDKGSEGVLTNELIRKWIAFGVENKMLCVMKDGSERIEKNLPDFMKEDIEIPSEAK